MQGCSCWFTGRVTGGWGEPTHKPGNRHSSGKSPENAQSPSRLSLALYQGSSASWNDGVILCHERTSYFTVWTKDGESADFPRKDTFCPIPGFRSENPVLGGSSLPCSITKVNLTVAKAVLIQKLKLQSNVDREPCFATSHDDRFDE
jgi:hypothetical protein